MKGSMAEYELGLLRQRARTAFEEKIRRGHVMWEVPVGFVRTDDNRLEKSADRQVQQAVTGVFHKFHELGSARQTMLWYRDAQLPLPEVQPGTAGRDLLWRLPSGHRINQMLTNPAYAGALAYGRTEAKTVIEDGRARQRTRRKKPREQWRILMLDNHPSYISWEEFLHNQQNRLPNYPKGKDWLTRTQAAARLGVSRTVITRLIAQGTLPASRVVSQAPWIIQRSALDLPAVQAAVQAVRAGRRRPRLRAEPSEFPLDSAHEGGDIDAASSRPDIPIPESVLRGE
jgi:excisionase family DNA binding protein